MKKILTVLCTIIIICTSGCSKTTSLRSELKGNKEAIKGIEEANIELEKNGIKGLKFESYDQTFKRATFAGDKFEVVYFVGDDGKITKINVNDDGGSKYVDAVNSVLKLDCLGLNVNNNNKIVGYFNSGKTDETNIDGYVVSMTPKSFSIYNKTEKSLSEAIPITIKDVELKDMSFYEDSIGTIYMKTKFENNSKKTIEYISYAYEIDGEKRYLMCTDTLLPGDTSTAKETFGPASKNKKDVKLLSAEFKLKGDKDGDDVYVDYDAKTEEYKWH